MFCLHARGAGRRHSVLRGGLSAAALGAGLLAAGPAAAVDSATATVVSVTSRSIVVQSDGSAYTEVAATSSNIAGEIAVDVNAGHAGRVVSYAAWPWLRLGSLGSADLFRNFKDSGQSKTYAKPRPKHVVESFGFAISRQHYADFVVDACNWQADSLRSQGLSNSQIFAQDRKIDVWVAAKVDAEMSGPGDPGEVAAGQINYGNSISVTCQRAPQVEGATLAVQGESSLNGACSVKLSGTIRTNLPSTAVSYRYHSDDGRKSEVRAVQTNASGTAQFSHDYPLSEGDIRTGKIRIVGENFDFTSDWADYEVDCRAPAQGYASSDPTPPDLTMVVGTTREQLYQGFICPVKVGLDTRILANDPMEGRAIHIAAQQDPLVAPQHEVQESSFKVVKGQHFAAGASFDLKWINVPVVGGIPPKQTMKFTFQVERHDTVIAETEKTVVLTCRKPETLGDSQGAPGDFGSTAPEAPDLSLSVATTGEKTVGSFACPATLTAKAMVKPNDAMDVVITHHLEQPSIMIGQSSQAKEQTVSLAKSQNYTSFPQSFDLNWQGLHSAAGQPLRQPVKMTVRLYKDRFLVAEQQKELVLECEGSVAEPPVLPPQAVRLHAYEIAHTTHRGLSCPAKVEIHGVLDGRGTTSGAAALFADGEPKALRQYSIEEGHKVVVKGEHELDWGPIQAQQNVKFAMNVTNEAGDIVDQMEATQNFVCRKGETSGVAQGSIGGVTNGKPAPTTHSQQAFSIQAPKGLVRQGQIRLSGGAANANYSLTFLRKQGGGYVAVNAAQLPRQMTGQVASFPLKALTGGRDWRIEVCSDGGAASGCKTADFRLTRIGGAASAPAPQQEEQPQGTIFLLPGVGQ